MSAPVAVPTPAIRFRVAPADTQVRIITGFYALAAVWCFGLVVKDSVQAQPVNQGYLIFGVVILVVMLWRWLNSVRGYLLEPGAADGPRLVIQQTAPWRRVPVPLSRLRRVDPAPPIRAILNLSVINLGSLFGWAGPANVPGIGSVLAYASSARGAMLLELAPRADVHYRPSDGGESRGPILLISPQDRAGLAAALQPYYAAPALGLPAAQPARPPAPAPRKKRR
ncbi:MAG: hypothetical protein M3Z04_18705 [Chloroflexota bacterium]|nr:hypothetical protein [Chloroflexota bacterium]